MKKLIFSLIVFSAFLGCQPKPGTADLVKNMVVTAVNYDATTDYSKYSTYSLVMDTISYFNSSDSDPRDTLQCSNCSGNNNLLGIFPSIITSEVESQLNDVGYKKVFIKQNPDLKVYVVIVENYSVQQSYSYYPYGYGGGYGYGYGYGGYGGYYPSVSVSDQADLYVQIFDLKNKVNGKPKLIWGVDIGDLVSSPDLGNLTVAAIDQAFNQSSYVKK